MNKCPNCGLPAKRTEDWACEWCGYPLISRNYRKIPQTFHEVWAERRGIIQENAVSYYEGGNAVEIVEKEAVAEKITDAETEIAVEEAAAEEAAEFEDIDEEEDEEPITSFEEEKAEDDFEEDVIGQVEESETEPELEAETELEQTDTDEFLPEETAAEAQAFEQAQAELSEEQAEVGAEEIAVEEIAEEPVAEVEAETEGEVKAEPVSEPELEPEADIPSELDKGIEMASGGIAITVEGLSSALQDDRTASSERFGGKHLNITGSVEKVVVRDNLDIYYALITGARKKPMWLVRCTFQPKHKNDLRRLQPGELVTVSGNYQGLERNVVMKDCALA